MIFIKNDLWRYSPPLEEAVIHQPGIDSFFYFRPEGFPTEEDPLGNNAEILIQLDGMVASAFERLIKVKKSCCDDFTSKKIMWNDREMVVAHNIHYKFCPICGDELEHSKKFLKQFDNKTQTQREVSDV